MQLFLWISSNADVSCDLKCFIALISYYASHVHTATKQMCCADALRLWWDFTGLCVSCRLKPCHNQDWYLLLWHVRTWGECWGGSRCGRKMLQTFICFTCGLQTFGINCYATITHLHYFLRVHSSACTHMHSQMHACTNTYTCAHAHAHTQMLLRGSRKCSSCCGSVLKAVF